MDMTITLGNVITIAVTIGGLFMAWSNIKERLVAIETQIGPMWSEYNDRRRHARRAEDDE